MTLKKNQIQKIKARECGDFEKHLLQEVHLTHSTLQTEYDLCDRIEKIQSTILHLMSEIHRLQIRLEQAERYNQKLKDALLQLGDRVSDVQGEYDDLWEEQLKEIESAENGPSRWFI